jgi:DNA-binding Lrp family transcriptional regulator
MAKKVSKSNKSSYDTAILDRLLKDPTRSVEDMAKGIDTYRQRVWRTKKRLEEEHIVWGYTAVVDESKLGHVVYMVLMKMRPMSKELAELIIRRLGRTEYGRQEVRLLDVLFTNGEFDWVVMFAAPDHATARRYYDSIRVAYEEHLLEKPTLVDVNFSLMREGKVNPELNRLEEFVPL